MLLDLSQFRTPREHVEKTFVPEAFPAEDGGLRVVAPVSLAFDIVKDKQHFTLKGTVRTVLEQVCSRCLEPFTWPAEAAFDLRYQPQSTAAGDIEREIEEDDLSTAFYENDAIDLSQLVREQCYLSLPMKPLCHGDCRGLCSVCGTNLNRGTCTCTRVWDDPRLAVLKTLRES